MGPCRLAAPWKSGLWLPAWRIPPPPATLANFIPSTLESWKGEKAKADMGYLERVAFYQFSRWFYWSPSHRDVDLFIGVGDHGQRFRSPFSPKTAYPGSGWRIEREGTRRLKSRDGPEATWRLLRSGTRRVVVLHWYEGTEGMADEELRSLLALDRSPRVRSLPGVVVRMGTTVEGADMEEVEEALRRLDRFYAEFEENLSALRAELRDYAAREQEFSGVYPLWENIFRRIGGRAS